MDAEEFILFKEEAIKLVHDAIDKVERLRENYDERVLYDAYSDVHTVKGEAGFFKLNDVAEVLHVVEEEIEKMRKVGKAEPEIIDDIKKKLLFVSARIKSAATSEIEREDVFSEYVKSFFYEYARYLGKMAELDFRIRAPVGDSMIHLMHIVIVLLRNALEHGIEMPSERRAKGKDEVGRIAIDISLEPGGRIELRYKDDGRGFPEEIVRRVNSGNVEEIRGVSSSCGRVSIHSGRGMGLFSIYKIITTKFSGGRIQIRSEMDRGCEVSISFYVRL